MKQIKIITLIMSILISSLFTGCSSQKLKPIDESYYKYGQKALEIADQCLNFEITPDETYEKLSRLCESADSLQKTDSYDKTHAANLSIGHDVTMLSFESMTLKHGSSDYSEFQEKRDDLYNDLSKCKIEE